MNKVYFDYAASTPVAPEVRQMLSEFYENHYGNSAGIHSFARDMKEHLDAAREFFAHHLGVKSSEVIFTASATESNNFILKGLAQRFPEKKHLVISAVEHASVFQTARYLEKFGFEVTQLPVDAQSKIDPDAVRKALRPTTLLVSVIWVNNELGTIQPLKEVGQVCREAEVFFHSDAVQGFGKLPLNVADCNLDFLTASAHKIYGPLGVGLAYIKEGLVPAPLLHGGGQENGLRSSTVNVPGIVGFRKAVELYEQQREAESARIRRFRTQILEMALNEIPDCRVNSPQDGLPHILNLSFKNTDGELLAILLDKQGIALSTGSACSTGKIKTSRILQAIGLAEPFKRGTLRISLGRFTTQQEVDYLLERLKEAVEKVRRMK